MSRDRILRVVLVLVGLLFAAGIYPLTTSLWGAKKADFGPMMLSIYVALGIFLLLAARNPASNRSLIAFAAWSSFAHAAVMVVQAYQDASDRGHLLVGVGLFGIIGLVFVALAPAKKAGDVATEASA